MTTNGEGKVAIHRWFETGESWAMHPWFTDREPLYDVLRPQLQGADGEFCIPGLGGVLLGEKIPDPECPDPKARTRHPTILRAVFLNEEPTARRRTDLLKKLRQLPAPLQPGPQTQLEIAIPARRTRRTDARADALEPTPDPSKPFSLKALFVGMLVVGLSLAMLAGLAYIAMPSLRGVGSPAGTTGLNSVPTNGVTGATLQPPVVGPVSPDTDLTPVQGEVPYLNERTRGQVDQILNPIRAYDHPYTAYLLDLRERLPEAAPTCKTLDEVRTALRRLLDRLQPGPETTDWSNERLREAIDRALSYETWRRGNSSRVFKDQRKPLPESQRRFVERFRVLDPAMLEASQTMAVMLRSWQDPPEKGYESPFVIIERFFARLTRPLVLPAPWKLDHPKVVFLARLPVDPVAQGEVFDSEADLAAALRRLLFHLEGTMPVETHAAPLLQRVRQQMDYKTWRSSRLETFRDAGAELPADLARLAARFDS